jgi:hypothetical protein
VATRVTRKEGGGGDLTQSSELRSYKVDKWTRWRAREGAESLQVARGRAAVKMATSGARTARYHPEEEGRGV